jgi:integrase
VTADSYQAGRAKQTLSPKTLNEYLGSMSSLLNWMEKHERVARNPLVHVQKVQANGRQVRPGRAFTDDEMQRLLAIAGPRKVVYLTAVYTGLRRSELAALERRDLHLEGEKPFINVRASTTKNHKQAVIALHPELVAEMRLHVSKLPAGASILFAGVMPTMKRFKSRPESSQHRFPQRNRAPGRLPFATSYARHQPCASRHSPPRGDGNHASQ